MSNILIVIGSARTGRVADKVIDYVKKDIESRENVTTTVADLKELNLPFFDSEQVPASPDYTLTDDNVIAWGKMVEAADSVLFITPEYNHSLTAIQKNALDWLYSQWIEKPVTAVAYGWSGGSLAVATLREVLSNLKTDTKESFAQLAFMKDLNPDGTLLDEASVANKIKAAIDELV